LAEPLKGVVEIVFEGRPEYDAVFAARPA